MFYHHLNLTPPDPRQRREALLAALIVVGLMVFVATLVVVL